MLQDLYVDPCTPDTMVIWGPPGSAVFLWVGSANSTNPGDVPDNMYDYVLMFESTSATKSSTWSQVKGLYQ